MRSGAQPSGAAAGSRGRSHIVLFASVLVAATLATLSQRGDTLSSVALVRLPAAAAGATGGSSSSSSTSSSSSSSSGGGGGGGGGSSTTSAPLNKASSNAAARANTAWSKQQPAAGRQPASVEAAAAHADPTSGTDAMTAADLAAAGSTGGGLTSQQAHSTAPKDSKAGDTTEAAAVAEGSAATPTVDDAAAAAGGAEPEVSSAHTGASAAGSSRECPCPPVETEADAAAAQAYGRDYFAICLSVKDQQKDIREWVAHHAAVGAGRLYIYDTGSNPPLNETLQDHIASGLVQYIWWQPDFGTGKGAGRKWPQEDIYRHCLGSFRGRHQFIGFIDSDEFLIPKNEPGSVPAVLQRMMAFEPFGALAVNWVVFGSSGHKERPPQGVLQAYTKCHPQQDNPHTAHIKSIVNTQFAENTKGPHHFNYTDSMYAVNEHFQRVDGPTYAPATVDKIALHHYVLKSEQEFREKMQRGSAMGNHKPFEFFTAMDRSANLTCTEAVGWGPYA